MKTILITMALIGFTIGGYAQNTKCTCTAKKKVTTTHKTASKSLAAAKKPATHKAVAQKTITKCPSPISYMGESSYTGNYPKSEVPRESQYLWPIQHTHTDVPTTDGNYYLNMNDGRCRWHCSPGLDQLDKQK